MSEATLAPVNERLYDRDFLYALEPEAKERDDAIIDLYEEEVRQDLYDDVQTKVDHATIEAVDAYEPDRQVVRAQIVEALEPLNDAERVEDISKTTAAILHFGRNAAMIPETSYAEVPKPKVSKFKKALSLFTGAPVQPTYSTKRLTERQLIERESEIGRELFGPIPGDHRREFFCLDQSTWVWHEEWPDVETGQLRSSTTRYEIHANGILKAQDGLTYKFIEGQELHNLALSVRLYYEEVMSEVYQRDPRTGQLLASEAPVTIDNR